MVPRLLRHASNSLEDIEHWYVRHMFSWVSRYLERVYGEGGKQRQKNRYREGDVGVDWGSLRDSEKYVVRVSGYASYKTGIM